MILGKPKEMCLVNTLTNQQAEMQEQSTLREQPQAAEPCPGRAFPGLALIDQHQVPEYSAAVKSLSNP